MKTSAFLKDLAVRIEKLENDGREIAIEANYTNTGIMENPLHNPSHEGFREYIDLGGWVMDIKVRCKNKDIKQIISEKP